MSRQGTVTIANDTNEHVFFDATVDGGCSKLVVRGAYAVSIKVEPVNDGYVDLIPHGGDTYQEEFTIQNSGIKKASYKRLDSVRGGGDPIPETFEFLVTEP